jgi:hypothetical protein
MVSICGLELVNLYGRIVRKSAKYRLEDYPSKALGGELGSC